LAQGVGGRPKCGARQQQVTTGNVVAVEARALVKNGGGGASAVFRGEAAGGRRSGAKN